MHYLIVIVNSMHVHILLSLSFQTYRVPAII